MTEDTEDDGFAVYVGDSEVIIRGVERRHETPENHPSEEKMVYVDAHVDFIENPSEGTHRVPFGRLMCEGGLPALNDHLRERDLAPEWWLENDPVPEELERP